MRECQKRKNTRGDVNAVAQRSVAQFPFVFILALPSTARCEKGRTTFFIFSFWLDGDVATSQEHAAPGMPHPPNVSTCARVRLPEIVACHERARHDARIYNNIHKYGHLQDNTGESNNGYVLYIRYLPVYFVIS